MKPHATAAGTGTARSRIAIAAKDKRIDAQFFRRVGLIARPYWLRKGAWLPWLLMAAVFGCAMLSGVIGGFETTITGQQTTALVAKRVDSFWPLTFSLIGLMVAGYAIGWFAEPMTSYVAIQWRRWLTADLTNRYLTERAYYDIAIDDDIDNPDQRMQEDVAPLCRALVDMSRKLFSLVVSLSIQVSILNKIAPAMTWALFLFVFLRSVGMIFVYRPSVGIAWDIKIAEADLRYGILHVRDNAETIAFYRGETAERNQIHKRLYHAVRQTLRKVVNDLQINVFNKLADLGLFILPLVFVVPLFLQGKIEYGAIASAAAAAMLINISLSQVSDLIPSLTAMAPNVVRLAQIIEKTNGIQERARTHATKPGQHSIDVRRHDDLIRLSHVTYDTPGGERSLARDISFELRHGQRMIVVGQTGVGKSSLLRVLAGLWTRGEGVLDAPPLDRALFMPQKPYMLLGTLRSQLLYPGKGDVLADDETLLAVLRRVHLPELAARHGGLDAERDWGRILSLGEQQRIGFARFLVNRPDHVFLDEATSAVDLPMEAHLYRLLVESGVTVVSVAHRTSIIPFHDLLLDLREDGWSLRPIDHRPYEDQEKPGIPRDLSSPSEISE